ncbi:hypothetical protein [Lysinibacillus sp.]|uniref:hypothetical protein n=1 Tax=Lysinibacillus sp. TaxID=1869345 RepID=UPI0028986BE7|nr:hypothetical protein [Lysinibacillus sp.]
MTQIKTYELYEQFKKQGEERAEKLHQFQKAASEAKARLRELETQYDQTFMGAVSKGTDATAELDEIMRDIDLQKEVVARREREERLAREAMPAGEITSVDVVDRYVNEYVPQVREQFLPSIEHRLKIGRDLIISALCDGRDLQQDYNGISDIMKEMNLANHKAGKLETLGFAPHPIREATILGEHGITAAVSQALRDIAGVTHGMYPHNYDYLVEVPAKETKKKGEGK